MGTPGCGVAAGAASGEAWPGGVEAAAPRCPFRPLEGYGPTGQALRSGRGPEGRGANFQDISVGKGCSQSGSSQLPRGWHEGILPQPQIREEDSERR